MSRRQQFAAMMASALVTLDGTAVTLALPAIGRQLSVPVFTLQELAAVPLVLLASLLLPSGLLADRYGRARVMRLGLLAVVAASATGASAQSTGWLLAARALVGLGGALILPAALAELRETSRGTTGRTRLFGSWVAWTGLASAIGPLGAALLVDSVSWRAVFLMPATVGVVAVVLLRPSEPSPAARQQPVPFAATASLVVVLGGGAYVLSRVPTLAFDASLVAATVLAGAGAVALARDPQRARLWPRALRASPNCLPANVSTFALYFNLFGMSFLLSLYMQQILGRSALSAALALLPVSVMLWLAEPFARLLPSWGTRRLVIAGTMAMVAGTIWIGTRAPVALSWPVLLLGSALIGLGLSIAVSALTEAAVSGVPEEFAGVASGLNHAVVRAGGVSAVTVLGSVAAPGLAEAITVEGMQRACLLCGAVVALVGAGGAMKLRDAAPGGVEASASTQS